MEISRRARKIGILSALLGVGVVAGGWYYVEFFGPANQPFALIKDWRHNEKEFTEFSEGAQWVHHQCHEPAMTRSPLGNPVALAAKEVQQKDAKTWSVAINSLARFSDGSEVLAEHYEKAWGFRKDFVKDPSFKRIASIKAIDTKRFEVSLIDFSSQELVLETLTSMWITPLKTVKQAWSWSAEVSAPCEGPFVPSIAAFDTLSMKRNKYWHDYDKSLVRRVSVLSGLGSRDAAADLFQAGKLTYVDSSIDPNLKSDFSGKRNSFLEPSAWYLVINQNGAFSKKFMPFPHHVMNRGDLESVVSGVRFFKVMYGLLPLSFVDIDGKPLYGSFVVTGPESLSEARRDLGFTEKALVTEIKPPFKKIRIYAADSEKISPLLRRYSERLKSNFNMESEIIRELPQGSGAPLDLAFIEVPLAQDLTKWAQLMIQNYEVVFPMPKETKEQFQLLSGLSSQPSVAAQQTSILQNLDHLSLDKKTIIPIGQFASAYLLSSAATGVQVRGDSRQDPDISHAKWMLQENR